MIAVADCSGKHAIHGEITHICRFLNWLDGAITIVGIVSNRSRLSTASGTLVNSVLVVDKSIAFFLGLPLDSPTVHSSKAIQT